MLQLPVYNLLQLLGINYIDGKSDCAIVITYIGPGLQIEYINSKWNWDSTITFVLEL